jgi:hypothetical protein
MISLYSAIFATTWTMYVQMLYWPRTLATYEIRKQTKGEIQ